MNPMPISDHILDALTGADLRQFEQNVRKLREVLTELGEFFDDGVVSVLNAVADSAVLGAREKDRRVTLILGSLSLPDRTLLLLAKQAQSFPIPIRNAIARHLPPEHRQLAFGKASGTDLSEATNETTEHDPSPLPASTITGESESGGQVLLVGTLQEHEHNSRLLDAKEIAWIRAATPADARRLLNDSVIAVVVARSCWTALLPEEHADFLRDVCKFSSFALIKVDITNLANPGEFDEICSLARCRGRREHQVIHGDTANLGEVEIPRLAETERALTATAGVHLYPADIRPEIARILVASVALHVDHRHYPRSVQLRAIGTTTMQGGHSQAQLVEAHPDDGGPPVVVKVAQRELLRDEMERFTRFIRPWDRHLGPELHFHDELGLIIFGLVDSPGEPNTPAPTLEQHLLGVLREETGGVPSSADLSSLKQLIQRLVTKVKELNARCAESPDVTSMTWLDTEPLKAAALRGLTWDFQESLPGVDPVMIAGEAAAKLKTHSQVATVHGDMHLRNTLVQDGREPFLIDYAYSGPGHPCYDLVWLESALTFRFFRMMSGETTLTSLFKRLLEPDVMVEKLLSEFPIDGKPMVNQLAMYAARACHDACAILLEQYGAPKWHYFVLKQLVACQSLVRPDVQQGVVRAMISATTPHAT